MGSGRNTDETHMRAALGLAARGLGSVWPNPAVGCVLVARDRVVGRGWTQPGGRPHAETQALDRAGEKARGATAYVTLEPCSHHGQTPPCADALIDAGVARCVVAMTDSDDRVSGQGLARLRAAGIEVTEGVLETEARTLNAGFLLRIGACRPLVTLKTATTLDGRIALANGESKWITGPEARALTHRLRADHDAVMVGSGTALADDPDLTCRLPGVRQRPIVRIVLDGGLRLPPHGSMVRSAATAPVWIVTRSGHPGERLDALRSAGAEIIEISADADGHPQPQAALEALADRGLTRILLEGGGTVAGAFLMVGLIDRVAWFRAPKVIGEDGRAAIAALGLDRLAESPDFLRTSAHPVGVDWVEFYERR